MGELDLELIGVYAMLPMGLTVQVRWGFDGFSCSLRIISVPMETPPGYDALCYFLLVDLVGIFGDFQGQRQSRCSDGIRGLATHIWAPIDPFILFAHATLFVILANLLQSFERYKFLTGNLIGTLYSASLTS